MASADTASTGWALSAGIRQRPPKIGWVVTRFVTQLGLVASPPPGVASSNVRTEAQIARTRFFAWSHDRDVYRDRPQEDVATGWVVTERPVLRRWQPVGWPGGGAKIAAWLTVPRAQGVLSEVLDHVTGVFRARACLIETQPGLVCDLRRCGRRFHSLGRHTLRPQQ